MLIQYIGNPSKIGRDESGISDGLIRVSNFRNNEVFLYNSFVVELILFLV